MKKFKKILLILILVIGLTGCSFGSKDKKTDEKKDKSNSKSNTESKPLELNTSLFNWVGSFKNKDNGISVDIYVWAVSDELMIDIDIPDNSNEEEVSSRGLSFEASSADDVLSFDEDFIGVKGSIKKTDNGIKIELEDAEEENKVIAGEYEKVDAIDTLNGYYVNGRTAVAINPLSDYVYVTYYVEETEDNLTFGSGGAVTCDDASATKIVCGDSEDEDYIKITKTDSGIKVDANNKKIKGDYKAKE